MKATVLSPNALKLATKSLALFYDPEPGQKWITKQGLVRITFNVKSFQMPYSTVHPSLWLEDSVTALDGGTVCVVPEWIRTIYGISLGEMLDFEVLEGQIKPAGSLVLKPLTPLPTMFDPAVIQMIGTIVTRYMPVSLLINDRVHYFMVDDIIPLNPDVDNTIAYECLEETGLEFTVDRCDEIPVDKIIDEIYKNDVDRFLLTVRASQMNISGTEKKTCVHVVTSGDERVFATLAKATCQSLNLDGWLGLDLLGVATDDELTVNDDRRERLVGRNVERVKSKPKHLLVLDGMERFTSEESLKLIVQMLSKLHFTCPGSTMLVTGGEKPSRLLKLLARNDQFRVDEFVPSTLSHQCRRLYLVDRLAADIGKLVDVMEWKLNGMELADLDALIDRIKLVDPLNEESFLAALQSLNVADKPSYLQLMTRNECSWDQIQGYKHQIKKIQNMLYGPWQERERYGAFGIKKSPGMLIHGPSGCGKSSIVQAIANDGIFNVYQLDLSELKSKYLGESESRLRLAFAKARQSAPCILFIDGMDALGRRRGVDAGGSSSGAEERLLSTMLNEMDGIEEAGGVIVVGCTSNMDGIDSAMKRPGRLDLHLEIGLPDEETRMDLIWYWCKLMKVDPSMEDVRRLAGLVEGRSGAEIVELFQVAGREAISHGQALSLAHLHKHI